VSGIPEEQKERGVGKFAMNGKSISEKEVRSFVCPPAMGQKFHRLLVFLYLSFFLS
jgi:hypothetical protein